MPAGIKNKGLLAHPVTDLSASGLPGLAKVATQPQPADATLSAAFRHALGGKPGDAHLPGASSKRGQEIAKQAKADRASAPQRGSPRKAHIGPRSGHK